MTGRITRASCDGALVTPNLTGLVPVRPGAPGAVPRSSYAFKPGT